MKKMKQILLLMTCVFVLLGTAACSSDKADNGADQSPESGMDRENADHSTDDNSNVNDVTSGNGILDDAVDDVTDRVDDAADDVTDSVDKAADEMTEDRGTDSDMQKNR